MTGLSFTGPVFRTRSASAKWKRTPRSGSLPRFIISIPCGARIHSFTADLNAFTPELNSFTLDLSSFSSDLSSFSSRSELFSSRPELFGVAAASVWKLFRRREDFCNEGVHLRLYDLGSKFEVWAGFWLFIHVP